MRAFFTPIKKQTQTRVCFFGYQIWPTLLLMSIHINLQFGNLIVWKWSSQYLGS